MKIIKKNNKLSMISKVLILMFVFVMPIFVFAQISCPSQTIFSSNYATLVGEIKDTGGDSNIDAWFEWGSSSYLSNRTNIQNFYVSYTPFQFCTTISNLQPCTIYYYRAVAKNSGGLDVGDIFSFRTKCINEPTSTISISSNQPPIAVIKYSPLDIKPGVKVTFNGLSSYDPDGYILSYIWKVNGILESTNSIFTRTLASGVYKIELTVIDNKGLKDSEELVISVGKNIFSTEVKTKTVTAEKIVYVKEPIAYADLVDVIFEDSYKILRCACPSSEITFSLINNTSVKRKVILEPEGEIKTWLDPQKKEFILNPKEKTTVYWKIYSPCDIKPDKYPLTFKLTTPGFTKSYRTALEVQSSQLSNLLSAFALAIFDNFPWFLVFILFIIISVLFFSYYKQKQKFSE